MTKKPKDYDHQPDEPPTPSGLTAIKDSIFFFNLPLGILQIPALCVSYSKPCYQSRNIFDAGVRNFWVLT